MSQAELAFRPAKAGQQPSLATLPVRVRNEIFSYILLARNVKHSNKGRPPGYKYNFDTAIMRANKQLYQDADRYLRANNEFALIHIKFFHFHIGLIPYVATEKEARSFSNPTIEATFQHTDSKCLCPLPCTTEQHRKKSKLVRILLLVDDLCHFTRQLQLAYHVWPCKPIYVFWSRNPHPVEYSVAKVDVQVSVIWKVNSDQEVNLGDAERIARQKRLVAPMAAVVNGGQKVTLCGADKDIVTRAVRRMTPRILSLDAVRWDLLEHMQHQKQYLDKLVSKGFQDASFLIDAYLSTSQLGRDSTMWSMFRAEHNTAFILSTVWNKGQATPVALGTIKDKNRANPLTESWLYGIARTTIECLFNAISLALDSGTWKPLIAQHAGTLVSLFVKAKCAQELPDDMKALAAHYFAMSFVFDDLYQGRFGIRSLYDDIFHINRQVNGPGDYPKDEYMREDLERLMQIDKVTRINDRHDPQLTHCFLRGLRVAPDAANICPGLYRRKRFFNEPMKLTRPESLHGWTSDALDMQPQLQDSIVKHADAAIKTGRVPAVGKTRHHGHVMHTVYNGPESGRPQYSTITFGG